MRILLLSANTATSPYPIYPLGLGMVSAALTEAGHEVRQFDYLKEGISMDALNSAVTEFQPELIGISVRNIDNVNYMNKQYYIDNVSELVAGLRKVSKARVMLGGAGFSLMPREILAATGADYGFVGEAEATVVKFASDAAKGVYPAERLMYSDRSLCGAMIPSATYEPAMMEFYLKSGNMASVQTKRGCSSHCVYCTYPLLEGHDIRPRDAASVVSDIETLRDAHACKTVFFVDSVFNDEGGQYLDVVREMIKRDTRVPWTGFFRPRALDDGAVKLMKASGLVAAEIGTDASSDITLKRMGKNFTFSDVIACNELFVSNAIPCSHFIMFGGPGETPQTAEEGIRNVLALKHCVVFIYMGIRIFPDTPLYEIALRDGVITGDTDLLRPTYYLSPGVDSAWLEARLTEAFKGVRHCIFPPDSIDSGLQVLHKLGHSGTLWDMLLHERKRKRTPAS